MDAVEAESLRQARAAFEAHPHDIACFIAEPIQGEAATGTSGRSSSPRCARCVTSSTRC